MLLITYWPEEVNPLACCPSPSSFLLFSPCLCSLWMPLSRQAIFSQTRLVHQQISGNTIMSSFAVKTKIFFSLPHSSFGIFHPCGLRNPIMLLLQWVTYLHVLSFSFTPAPIIKTLFYNPTVWDYQKLNATEENSVAIHTHTHTRMDFLFGLL